MSPPVLCLYGPTAVGKTAIAVELCERLGAEVVGADSRQVYRGLELGSAAPTDDELARAPHHLIGFLEPHETFDVAEFVPAAEARLTDLLDRGRTPLIVAGTAMWLKALTAGWTFAGVGGDEAVRARLEAEAEELGNELLHQRLSELDPATAERLHVSDRKRLVRALEVYELTGRPLSEVLAEEGTRDVPYDYRIAILSRPREELYRRIDERVLKLLEAGWLDEVRALLARGLTGEERALEGLGYPRLVAHLRGELEFDEAIALIQQDTRRFAKRQVTWERKLGGAERFELGADETAGKAAARIVQWWHGADFEYDA